MATPDHTVSSNAFGTDGSSHARGSRRVGEAGPTVAGGPPTRTATNRLINRAASYAAARPVTAVAKPAPPATGVAVVACMDARLDVSALLGLAEGDAHVMRNAGGVITDDMIRSLVISQHELGTTEIILIHHTECGLMTITDEGFREKLGASAGMLPPWPVHAFADLDQDVRDGIRRLAESPFLAATTSIRGFVYDVASGALREVTP
jgi:carbonic anhydrase